jgi:hypothetical protein
MDIFLVCVIVVLLLLVIHWLPWGLILGKRIPRVAEIWMSLIGVSAPVTVSITVTRADARDSVVLVWAAVASGGLAILLAYWVDDWAIQRARAMEAEAREKALQDAFEEVERRR